MATGASSNGKKGKEVKLGLTGKDGEKIPLESPKQGIDIKVRAWPEASKKT